MNKEIEETYNRIADEVEKIEIPDFALWVLLGKYQKNLEDRLNNMSVNNSIDAFTLAGLRNAYNSIETIRDDLYFGLF